MIAERKAKGRPLCPDGGDDCVMTPPELAEAIVAHFRPSGICCEPCRGSRHGAFFKAMSASKCGEPFWYEILEGRDFLEPTYHMAGYDWIVTNPPWSKFRPFLIQSMKLADNVVFLAPVNNWWTKARRRDMDAAGFGTVETLLVPTPPEPWPQSGFQLAAVWMRRGWKGGNSITQL